MRLLTALCLLAASAVQPAAVGPESFRFTKAIEPERSDEDVMASVVLDGDAFSATRDGMPDLRIFDGQGKQTPLLVERAVEKVERQTRATLPSRVVALREREDRLRIIVELEDEAKGADGLSVFTPLKDYECRVRVFGSGDDFRWMPLEEDGLIFDYSRFIDVKNRDVSLADNDYRRYAVEIIPVENVQESLFREMTRRYHGQEEIERVEKTVFRRRPFRVDRIEMWQNRSETVKQRDKKTDYYVSVSHIEDDASERVTTIDVSARRQPITKLILETDSQNFKRPVRVQIPTARHGRTEWRDIAAGTVSLIRFGTFCEDRLAVSFPEQRAAEYRIVIENGDNQPLRINGVKAVGNAYQAVFIAVPDESYTLAYGSESAERADYDAAAVLAPLRARGHRPTPAKLGPEIINPSVKISDGALRELFASPVFLGTVVVVLVVLLGWALYAAVRRIDRLPRG